MVAAVESLKERLEATRASLKNERTSWEQPWRDIDRYVLPDRCQWTITDHNQSKADSYDRIIDDTPVRAIRTCASGLHSGITNPSRPWFELALADKDLSELPAVRAWLESCRDRMLDAFRSSNLYNALPITYGNCAAFGIDALVMEDDDDEVFRFENLAIGTYWISTNAKRRVDCIVREIRMTVRQVVERFGEDKVSETVRSRWNLKGYEDPVDVVHVVCPNADYNPRGIMSREKRYLSTYYEANSAKSPDFLSIKGFDSFPVLCPRWEVTGRNAYGQGPGKQIRGHAKALQAYKRALDKGTNKMADPPLTAPSSMRGQTTTQIAGGITYYDESKGGAPLVQPLYNTHTFPVEKVFPLIQDARQQIEAGCFADLFLMIANSDRRQVTAEEIRAKQEEKLLQIGPVLENLNDELLDPLIARAFTSMLARGLMPEPPEEIQGQALIVQYVSMMAQVQKMLGLGALDRLLGVLGNISSIKPDVIDNFDADKVALEYHDMLGVTNRVIRVPEERDQMRQGRAQAQQQQAQAEQQVQQAQAAKLLSETDTRSENALTDLINAQRGVAAA
jgi:hypothetical protein